MERNAGQYFRAKGRLNCAQAVAMAFREEGGFSEEDIRALKKMGGGRAPGGVCGSLHIARTLIHDPEKLAKLEEAFAHRAGSCACKQIRRMRRVSCRDTVELAARELDKYY
jgi:hypothetical protein